ncbi:MAG: hypothetical protein ACMUHU_05100 [Thermoplasmatota archaeon]
MKYNRPIGNMSALKIERKWNRMDPNVPYGVYLDGEEIEMVLWGGAIKQMIIEPGRHRLQFRFVHMYTPFRSEEVEFEVGPYERISFEIGYDMGGIWQKVFPSLGYFRSRKKFYIKQVGIDRMEPDDRVHEILG